MEKAFVGMSFFQKRVYPALPVFLQNAAVSMYGLYWRQRRFGGIYQKELRAFKEREFFTAQQWRDYQTVQLRKLLVHAFETVPFYRERYGALGWTKSKFERFELDWLSQLPCLSKDDLRRHGTTKLLSSVQEKGGRFFSSSGSTGTPTQILYSTPFHRRWSAAFEARIRHWAGVNRFSPRGMIGGRRVVLDAHVSAPFYRYNFFEKQVYFSAYHISPSSILSYLEGILKYSLEYMTGYAMSNFFLANFIKEAGLKAPRLKAVITSSESLTGRMRKVFWDVYGCKTFDSYSGVEACGLVSETEHGDMLVSPDVGILELVRPDSTPALPGETGEVISTGLLNYDQPLIRYKIGDTMSWSRDQSTDCGREMPRIERIEGRVEDVIVGKDGRKMVRFHSLYVGLPGIVAAQIVQEDYGKFIFNIVRDEGFRADNERQIIDRLRSQIGVTQVSFNYLPELPKSKNGKIQAVVTKVPKKGN